jgi:hypothetical protein
MANERVRFSFGSGLQFLPKTFRKDVESHLPHGVRELRVQDISRGAASDHRRSAW